MKSKEIRESFFDFFESKGHRLVPSSPVVLPSDPSLLFTNAGMNQFKDIFLGLRRSSERRVVNTQKCIRVSGKHNDLEEVGVDTYHHTFFEMLGNWSFGDYYKEQAIAWAWELLTEVWGLPKERLWVTVYHTDEETQNLWIEKTDIDPDRILRFGDKENFWEMGATGPCGPCSEIHYDATDKGCTPEMINADHPEVIEIWNLVFIQHNRDKDGTLNDLESKHIDTGMGLERIAAILQGKKSNYDTDIFVPLIEKMVDISGRSYENDDAIAMRVISDHIRTLSIAIGDGVLPSNEGRGYVLRRILRRAVRYGRKLGLERPFLSELFPALEESMGDFFPELSSRREDILRALESEEKSFSVTLDRGLELFEEVADWVVNEERDIFPGSEAFKLYDTYGFPFDLTSLMASERGLKVDDAEFGDLMEQQRERARQAQQNDDSESKTKIISLLKERDISSEFCGYEEFETETKLLGLLVKEELVESISGADEAQILLAKTPFYAESGGQLGDRGFIKSDSGTFEVRDTQTLSPGLVLHSGRLVSGSLHRGESVWASVASERRNRTAAHHTATHLLNAALRELVSDSVKQAGSMVANDRLRFDFNYFESLTDKQMRSIERRVNEWIRANLPVSKYKMIKNEVAGTDIVADFDEKYSDEVRVVDVEGVSRELCGGTHVDRTGDIGQFRLVAESSVAAGIRRLEAVCGAAAYDISVTERDLLRDLSKALAVSSPELPERVETLSRKNKELEKELKQLRLEAATEGVEELLESVSAVAGIPLLTADLGEMDMDAVQGVMDKLRAELDSGLIILGSSSQGKALFLASASRDVVDKGVHAGNLIAQIAQIAKGGGGGQPDRAQAGGKDGSKVSEALDQTVDFLKSML